MAIYLLTLQKKKSKLLHKINEAEKWGEKNNAKFDLAKAKASYIFFDTTTKYDKRKTKNKRINSVPLMPLDFSRPEIKLYGQDIEPVYLTKYLGLILDSELTFEYHFNEMIEKATKARTMMAHALIMESFGEERPYFKCWTQKSTLLLQLGIAT